MPIADIFGSCAYALTANDITQALMIAREKYKERAGHFLEKGNTT